MARPPRRISVGAFFAAAIHTSFVPLWALVMAERSELLRLMVTVVPALVTLGAYQSSVVTPLGESTAAAATRFTFDAVGQMVAQTDPAGIVGGGQGDA